MSHTEHEKGLALALQGRERERALEAFQAQMAQWGVVMPPVEPMVVDFRLGDFMHTGLIEYWIANEIEAGYCGKFLFVFDGQTCPLHHHKDKHETFFILHGRALITVNGESREMQPGDVLPVPPGAVHSFTGIGPMLLLEVSRACTIADNYFEDPTIPIGGGRDV